MLNADGPTGVNRRHARRSLGAILVIGFLAACAGKPSPTMLDLKLTAGADVNPDAAGRPAPIVVTLYQLKSPTAFQAADYFQLAGKPEQALGDSLVVSEQVVLAPGQALTLLRELDPATQHIGLAASFRAIDRAEWKSVVKLELNKANGLGATLAGTALALKPAGK